jgi:hypothetical protein
MADNLEQIFLKSFEEAKAKSLEQNLESMGETVRRIQAQEVFELFESNVRKRVFLAKRLNEAWKGAAALQNALNFEIGLYDLANGGKQKKIPFVFSSRERRAEAACGDGVKKAATRLFHEAGVVADLLHTLQLNPMTVSTLDYYLSK